MHLRIIPLAVLFLSSHCFAFLPLQQKQQPRRHHHTRYFSKKNTSAAAQERRKEEQRQLERKDDVVIGKTSAIPNAKDYSINPTATEQAFLQQASALERLVYMETEKGLEALKMMDIQTANRAFNVVFEHKPESYLWQAGIVKYYLNDFERAAEIFNQAADFFEGRFQQVASEERIWRDACRLKMKQQQNGIEKNDNEPPNNEENELLQGETRKVHKIALELFSASLEQDLGAMVVARAKLYDIASSTSTSKNADVKMWKLSSWFYLALHHDAMGNQEAQEESKRCCKAALVTCPATGNAQDIIHTLPALHMMCRDFYDDDEIEASESGAMTFAESIQTSLEQMKKAELQDILRKRDIKHCGSKQEVLDRVFHALIEDA